MSETGYCLYQFNIHEQYVNPEMGIVCGKTTYTLEDRGNPDPWCPDHGGTESPSSNTSESTTTSTGGRSSGRNRTNT